MVKTTTTTLLGRMFEEQFGGSRTAGNIGIPLSDVVNDENLPIAVELSSFQIETLDTFHPECAVFLNVSPNHLDWYETYDDYVRAKIDLIKNMSDSDLIIYNKDDERLEIELGKSVSKKKTFSLNQAADAMIENDSIIFKDNNYTLSLNKLKLKGPHHLYNYMAATLVAINYQIEPEIVKKVIYEFDGLIHRMEFFWKLFWN